MRGVEGADVGGRKPRAARKASRTSSSTRPANILHPDLRNCGGFLETKRIADLARLFGLPMPNHNTGSQVCTYATEQWAASIRDYNALETVTGQGGWMDQVSMKSNGATNEQRV